MCALKGFEHKIEKKRKKRKRSIKNKVIFKKSFDVHYNTDSPKRRSPDLSRIKSTITWNPIVSLEKGIERTIKSYL